MRPLRASGELDLLCAGRRSISGPGSGTAATLRRVSCGVLLVFSGRQATAAGHTDRQNPALAAESGAEFVSIRTFVVGSDRPARGLAAKFRLSGAGIDSVASMLQNPLIVTEAGRAPGPSWAMLGSRLRPVHAPITESGHSAEPIGYPAQYRIEFLEQLSRSLV
jgi:hypothetical protein